VEVYAAQLIWPASQPFPNIDTAFTYVAGRAWAPLFAVVGFTLLVANFGSGMGAQLGAARLLYGMGRSKALPQSFFGVLEPKRRVPRNNVIFVGVIALAGAFVLSYGLGAEMLNFGALIAFMGVNLAAFLRYNVRDGKTNPVVPGLLTAAVILVAALPNPPTTAWIIGGGALAVLAVWTPPLAGFSICFFLWKNLSWKAWASPSALSRPAASAATWLTLNFPRKKADLVKFNGGRASPLARIYCTFHPLASIAGLAVPNSAAP
jgi:amino acid transporter